MAKYSSKELNAVYHALANSTRRKILARLAKETCTISELAKPFDMSLAAISKHIKVLQKAGLVHKKRKANTYYCSIDFSPLQNAAGLIYYFEKFWEEPAQEKKAS